MFIGFILSLFLRHYSLDRTVVRGDPVKKVDAESAELGVVAQEKKEIVSTPSSSSEDTLDDGKVETKGESIPVVAEQK